MNKAPSYSHLLIDFGPNGRGMIHCLEQLSGTVFGHSFMIQRVDDIRKMSRDEVHKIFNCFVRISEKLSFHLTNSAATKNSLVTTMPEIFN
jgi:hypothetical protein